MNRFCRLCLKEAQVQVSPSGIIFCQCVECGRFGYTSLALDGHATEQLFKISCILVEKKLMGISGVVILSRGNSFAGEKGWTGYIVEDLLNEFPVRGLDIFHRSLLNLGRLLEKPAQVLQVNDHIHRPIFSESRDDVEYFFKQMAKGGYVTEYSGFASATQLTMKAWEEIGRLNGNGDVRSQKKTGFVAMWFSP